MTAAGIPIELNKCQVCGCTESTLRMQLRIHFAAAALTGIHASGVERSNPEYDAVRSADKMLAELGL